MLHNRQKLDVRESQFLHIRDQAVSEFDVTQEPVTILGNPLPGPEMDLIDAHRRRIRIALLALFHPLGIRPSEAVQIKNHAAGFNRVLREKGVGVGF